LLFEALKRATADQEGWAKTQRILEMRHNVSTTLARKETRRAPEATPSATKVNKGEQAGEPPKALF